MPTRCQRPTPARSYASIQPWSPDSKPPRRARLPSPQCLHARRARSGWRTPAARRGPPHAAGTSACPAGNAAQATRPRRAGCGDAGGHRHRPRYSRSDRARAARHLRRGAATPGRPPVLMSQRPRSRPANPRDRRTRCGIASANRGPRSAQALAAGRETLEGRREGRPRAIHRKRSACGATRPGGTTSLIVSTADSLTSVAPCTSCGGPPSRTPARLVHPTTCTRSES